MAHQITEGNAQFESIMGPVVLSALIMLGGAATANASGHAQNAPTASSETAETSAASLASDDYNRYVTADSENAAQNLEMLKEMKLGSGSTVYEMMKRDGAGRGELDSFRAAYIKELGKWSAPSTGTQMSPEEYEAEAMRIAEKTLSGKNISAVRDSKEIRAAAILGAYAGLARKSGGHAYVSGSSHTSDQIDAERKTLMKEAAAKYGKAGEIMAAQAYSTSAAEAK